MSIHKLMLRILLAMGVLLECYTQTSAQVLPPRPISVYVNPAQPLCFGAFFQGSLGGSVIVYPNGSRAATGDVILANVGFSASPAMFEVEGQAGTLVSIMVGPSVTLNGSNGGTMNLRVAAPAPFIINTSPPGRTVVNIGGTLTVGSQAANPAGSYSGTFNVTFMEQ